jgi:glyoxylase-like metal-dependent hydrolase (beta-lactamase superfamily II)
MKVHAIQTGAVRIKSAQVEGRGHGLPRRLAIFADPTWTDWLPTCICSNRENHCIPADLAPEPFGPFPASRRLTQAGDIIAVATPGHTAGHLSIVVQGDDTLFLAGDASYDERLMLAGKVDGVSADDRIAGATLDMIKRYAQTRPTVYLPTHDPHSATRLANHRLVGGHGMAAGT